MKTVFDVRLDFNLSYILSIYINFRSDNISITFMVSRPLTLKLTLKFNLNQNDFRCAARLEPKLHFIPLSFFDRIISSITFVVYRHFIPNLI